MSFKSVCLIAAHLNLFCFLFDFDGLTKSTLTRAAAYTQINHYAEAIRDCLKSIEINPSYSKAYSRLGFAYYAQGNYRDAVNKGFMKGWYASILK